MDLPIKYNFVFFGASYDYSRALLGKDLYDCEYVHIYKGAFEGNIILQKLFHYHWSYRVNRKINLPFKCLWFKKMYHQNFIRNLPLCFVYYGGLNLLYDRGFTEYVRKQNPSNRQVILHEDKVDKGGKTDYKTLHAKVDLVITYDEMEAKKYGIHYFNQDCYSKIIPEPEHPDIIYDAYFIASVKDRLPQIMAVYHHLVNQGVKCKFMLAGVPKEKQITYLGIEYITNISYKENLENVIHSRCVIEIVQGGTVATTLRAKEAIAYRRRLLTNCPSVNPQQFHHGQLQFFDTPESIDCSFIRAPFEPNEYAPLVDLNPMKRLYDIQDQLDKLEK